MYDIPLTITGNLTKDPELRYRPGGGGAVLRFTVASTPRHYSKAEREYVDGETTFMPCVMFSRGEGKSNVYLERLAEDFTAGDRVIALGELVTRVAGDGEDHRSWVELTVKELGASARFARLSIERTNG